MAKTVNTYPEWVEKYRKKGVTIRKTKYGYGLYRCTSVYVKGAKYPRSVQEFLGMVYEDKGFVPKSEKKEYRKPHYLEYGLSFFLMNNFHRELLRSSYDRNEDIVKLGIIEYIFHNHSEISLSNCYLSFNDERLREYSFKASDKRIHTIVLNIQRLLSEKIKDRKDLDDLINLLRLSVYDLNNDVFPQMSEELKTLAEKYGVKLW